MIKLNIAENYKLSWILALFRYACYEYVALYIKSRSPVDVRTTCVLKLKSNIPIYGNISIYDM